MATESRLSVPVKMLLLDLIEMAPTSDHGIEYSSETIDQLKRQARELILSDGQSSGASS